MSQQVTECATWKYAHAEWALHDCPSESDVCTCLYAFPCARCGQRTVMAGEEMPQLLEEGGACGNCVYSLEMGADACPACGVKTGYPGDGAPCVECLEAC